eukprot:865589-Rhodomonas_salina.1
MSKAPSVGRARQDAKRRPRTRGRMGGRVRERRRRTCFPMAMDWRTVLSLTSWARSCSRTSSSRSPFSARSCTSRASMSATRALSSCSRR